MGQVVKVERNELSMVDMLGQADMLVKSGLMPKEINTKEKVVSVAIFGKAHGLSFEEATIGGDIYVFEAKGKLLMMVKSERKLEQMMSTIPGFHFDIHIETNERLKVDFFRMMNGHKVKVSVDISITDKDIAHLTGKDNWKYSKTMLWHTACRRLGTKWPDWKRMNKNIDIADLETANEAISDLYEENGRVVNTQTGEIIQEAEVLQEAGNTEEEVAEVEATIIYPHEIVWKETTPIDQKVCSNPDCNRKLDDKVFEFSTKKYGKAFCFDCQKLVKLGEN